MCVWIYANLFILGSLLLDSALLALYNGFMRLRTPSTVESLTLLIPSIYMVLNDLLLNFTQFGIVLTDNINNKGLLVWGEHRPTCPAACLLLPRSS